MKRILLGLLMALAVLSAQADLSFAPGNGDLVILHEQVACPAQLTELAHKSIVIPNFPPLFSAEATVGGKHYNACWFDGGGFAGLIYEDGDLGAIPAELLTKLKET